MRHNLSTSEIDALLRRVAERQLGLLTVAQVALLGVDRYAVARRRRDGALIPTFGGVMRLAAVQPSVPQRILSGALAVPGATIAGPSAAVMHGFPIPLQWSHDRSRVVVAVHTSRSVALPEIIAVRQKTAPPSKPWATVRIATPAATLLLLPKFLDHETVERNLDHCILNRLVTPRSVADLIMSMPIPAVYGRRFLLELVATRMGETGHRSRKEQHVGVWLRGSCLGGYRRNYLVAVRSGNPIEVDFAWPRWKIALEVSPYFTHGSRSTQARDMLRRRLLVEMGWRIVEVSDADLKNSRAFAPTIALLRRMLESS